LLLKISRLALMLLLPLAVGLPAYAQSASEDVRVPSAWSRATPGPTAAVYLSMQNTAGQPDKLTAATSPIAEHIEFHAEHNQSGVVSMVALEGIDLPPGQMVTLAPGQMHMMMFGVQKPLKAGDQFPLTLEFEHSGAKSVTVTVAGPGAIVPPP
jgi:periplasmic copper chaperone A